MHGFEQRPVLRGWSAVLLCAAPLRDWRLANVRYFSHR